MIDRPGVSAPLPSHSISFEQRQLLVFAAGGVKGQVSVFKKQQHSHRNVVSSSASAVDQR